jgi:hypothetical protein
VKEDWNFRGEAEVEIAQTVRSPPKFSSDMVMIAHLAQSFAGGVKGSFAYMARLGRMVGPPIITR